MKLLSFILTAILFSIPALVRTQITASVVEGCAPLTGVLFETSYSNPTNINWDFDDGASSNLAEPSHTFALPGTYNVVFTANVNGSPVSNTIVISVYDLPDVSFTVIEPGGGCVGLQVSFDDTSVGGGGSSIAEWQWAFGDGGVNAVNTGSPSYQYNLPGIFDVGLIVTDANGCVASVTQNDAVTISQQPQVTVTTNPDPPSACDPPLNVVFASTATSNSPLSNQLTYQWDFDNGSTSTAADPPAVTYTEVGQYVVTLTVTDDNNCSKTVTEQVSIAQPFANFSALGGENDTVCANVIFLNASSGISPFLDYGDGTSGIGFQHSYTAEGWYDVYLEVESGPCQDDTTISIYVQIPEVEIVLPYDTICDFPFLFEATANSDYVIDEYEWVLPSQETSSEAVASEELLYDQLEFSINHAREADVSLTITTADGCTASDEESFVYVKPNALFFPLDDEGCAPLSVTFVDYSSTDYPSITQWIWHFEDGSPPLNATNNNNVEHVYEEEGIYHPFLEVVTNNGCRDTSWVHTIFVGAEPSPSFVLSETEVCPGDTIEITDTTSPADSVDTWNYSGDNNLIFTCQTDPNPSVVFVSETGIATITMTAGYNGCYATTTQTIEVHGPVGELSHTCNCETPLDYPFTATVSDASHWDWDFGDGTSELNSTVTSLNHSYATPGDYWAVLTTYNDEAGCNPDIDSMFIRVRDLEVNFSIPDSICSGTELEFSTTSSTGAAAEDGVCYNSFVWYFGDDTRPKATNSVYSHEYENSGTFTVELWGEDINGCIDSASHVLNVFGISADFSYVTDGVCLPMAVNFESEANSDLPISSYFWQFGDGSTSTEINPDHVYDGSQDGPFTITLIVTDTFGCSYETFDSIEPDIPNADFVALTPTTFCVGGTVTFDPVLPEAGAQFFWTFGDGATSTVYNPTHTYDEPGLFTVTLEVINANGCTNSSEEIDFINSQAYPIAGFNTSIGEDEVLCYPAQIIFTDTSIVDNFGSRDWDLGNGTPTIGSESIGANYDAPGTYTITLIEETTAGCADTTSLTILVQGPVGDFELSPAVICRGEEINLQITDTTDVLTWQWDFGDGTDAGPLWEVTHDYDFAFNPSSGSTVVSLVLWNQDSICSAVITSEVDFIEATAGFLRNNEIAEVDSMHCFGIADIFTDASSDNIDIWNWDFGNGQTYNGPNPPAINYQPGDYLVTLAVQANPEGCVDTLTKLMTIFPLPNPTATGGAICLGDSLQLNATGGVAYVWDPPLDLSDFEAQNPLAFPEFTQDYEVTVTDTNDCVNTASTTVTVFQPLVPVDELYEIIIGETIELNVSPGEGYSYEWIPDIWISCTVCPDPTLQPLQDTVYYVTITDDLGCFSVTSRYEVIVLPLSSLDVPDVFTPNGDGVNDVVYVRGWGIEDLISFKIYNRWGELVFETSDADEGWDGRYKGELQMADTFAYVVEAKPYISDIPMTKEGFINLVR